LCLMVADSWHRVSAASCFTPHTSMRLWPLVSSLLLLCSIPSRHSPTTQCNVSNQMIQISTDALSARCSGHFVVIGTWILQHLPPLLLPSKHIPPKFLKPIPLLNLLIFNLLNMSPPRPLPCQSLYHASLLSRSHVNPHPHRPPRPFENLIRYLRCNFRETPIQFAREGVIWFLRDLGRH